MAGWFRKFSDSIGVKSGYHFDSGMGGIHGSSAMECTTKNYFVTGYQVKIVGKAGDVYRIDMIDPSTGASYLEKLINDGKLEKEQSGETQLLHLYMIF